MKRQIILVLGMHRSGTSCVAGILHNMGLHVHNTLGANSENPKGFFEDSDIVSMNDGILGGCGNGWASPAPVQMQPHYRAACVSQIADMLHKKCTGTNLVVKDPRICKLADLYLEAIAKIGAKSTVVWVSRSPAAITASLLKRAEKVFPDDKHWTPEYCAALIGHHEQCIRAVQHRKLHLRYESIVRNPRAACLRIKAFIPATRQNILKVKRFVTLVADLNLKCKHNSKVIIPRKKTVVPDLNVNTTYQQIRKL